MNAQTREIGMNISFTSISISLTNESTKQIKRIYNHKASMIRAMLSYVDTNENV